MTSARQLVLERIRAALGPSPSIPDVLRAYHPSGTTAPDVERFCDRVAEYRATVHRATPDTLAGVVRGLCRGRTAVAPEPPCDLDGIDATTDDPPLPTADLDAADSVLTGCAGAIAETGTIVLDGGASCGRRALTLVPDHHVCVVHAAQVVAAVPDAIEALAPTAPLTFVSGPSATSDIELERVEGVHGPRRLDVVVVGARGGAAPGEERTAGERSFDGV